MAGRDDLADQTLTLRPEASTEGPSGAGPRAWTLILIETPSGRGLGSRFPADPIPRTMGRGAVLEDGSPLDDPAMSRRHFEWRTDPRGEVLEVRDLASKNGTWLSEGPLPRAFTALADGRVFRAGDTWWMVRRTQVPPPPDADVPEFLGHGDEARRVRSAIARFAASPATALLLGETGTGKEVAARAIWRLGGDRRPFLAFNSASVPPTLIDSTLFGHVRGAFTGAHHDHPGLFQAAAGGVLFLDEIGDIPPETQARLLRVLEEGAVLPLGGTRPVPVAARVIAATSRDLPAEVRAGRFRGDLYARLARLVLTLPPLRQRLEDLPRLVRHFGDGHPLAPDLWWALLGHPWPFHVRELRGTIESLQVDQPGPAPWRRTPALEDRLRDSLRAAGANTTAAGQSPGPPDPGAPVPLPPDAPRRGPPGPEAIRAALVRHRGNVSRAAQDLGLDRAYCYRLMERYRIDPASLRPLDPDDPSR